MMMKILDDVRGTYKEYDPEVDFFLKCFDENPPAKVLEVGSYDAPIAGMLTQTGFDVVSVDLRPHELPTYHHVVGDFCALPSEFWAEHKGTFDVVISVSAIEHFGLDAYGEGTPSTYYDVMAMRYIYDALKVGGCCYLVVPFGGKFFELPGHWRVYDFPSMMDRLVQDFLLESLHVVVVEEHSTGTGVVFKPGTTVGLSEVIHHRQGSPYLSALAKMRKVPTDRRFRVSRFPTTMGAMWKSNGEPVKGVVQGV